MSGQYVISKHGDGWMVSVDGAGLLICESRPTAICAVQDATSSQDGPAGASGTPPGANAAESREGRRAFVVVAAR